MSDAEELCYICQKPIVFADGSKTAECRHYIRFNEDITPLRDAFSLDTFLSEVKDSCTNHAARKGYTNTQGSDGGDVFGQTLLLLGVAKDHAFGEIIAKLIEYKKEPRRVLAVKIAGWAWRLWLNTER